jgi:hypothetical protein
MNRCLLKTVTPLLAALWLLTGCGEKIVEGDAPPAAGLAEAEALLGLEFTPRERALMREDLAEQRAAFLALRARTPANDVAPPLVFDPRPAGFRPPLPDRPPRWRGPLHGVPYGVKDLLAVRGTRTTWGSIVSPSMRCGTTGLRPTFGRVSRAGAMALSWSMDKLGPMARCAEDCALVFETIRGADGRDPSVIEAPFPYAPRA